MAPLGSMKKYMSEQGGQEHNGLLHWPGTTDGYPYRGDNAPNLKQQEMEQLALALDYKSQMFCLWEPAQKAVFDAVMDRIVNGWYMQHRRKDEWDAVHNHYRVWLEWVQVYGETPAGKHPGNASGSEQNGNTKTANVTISPGDPRASVLLAL